MIKSHNNRKSLEWKKVHNATSSEQFQNLALTDRIGGVMVSVLALSAVDRGFEPRSGQTKYYRIGICFFSAKHVTLRKKSKDWLTLNQDNVSEWGDMSIRGLLFHWTSTIQIQLSLLLQSKADLIIISLHINLFSPWHSWEIAVLVLNSNHSLPSNHIHARSLPWLDASTYMEKKMVGLNQF